MDRIAGERYRIPVAWLMEAAGWQLARHCRGRVVVACGHGNNGGDGLAAARHLHRWGRLAGVACLEPYAFRGAAAEEAGALRAIGVELASGLELTGATTVLDALLGTGLSRPVGGRLAEWIEAINASGARVVSADLPSGLDSDTGRTIGACVRAAVTVTLGLPKPGLLVGKGPEVAGEVWVADIGVPREAYAAVGIQVPDHLFSMHDRVELRSLRL